MEAAGLSGAADTRAPARIRTEDIQRALENPHVAKVVEVFRGNVIEINPL